MPLVTIIETPLKKSPFKIITKIFISNILDNLSSWFNQIGRPSSKYALVRLFWGSKQDVTDSRFCLIVIGQFRSETSTEM